MTSATTKIKKIIMVMASGETKDVSDKFTAMPDALFARIVAANKAAGRDYPVSWHYEEATVELSKSDMLEIEYDKHAAAVRKAMSY